VKAQILESEFSRLIKALVIRPETASKMAEAFAQGNQQGHSESERTEILTEIALCKQRIKNAETLFLKARIDQHEIDKYIEENEKESARLQVTLSEEAQIKEMMELSIKMFTEMGSEWDKASNEDKQEYAQSLFSEIIFDLDSHCITGFNVKPRVEPFLRVQVSSEACLEGFRLSAGSLPSIQEAMHFILCLIYGDSPAELQSWEKRERNAEIYHRYLAGENSVVLGRAFGLSDRRIRTIIETFRKRGGP
jgi:hypothetical protein